jgi:sugar/nucleoside kinase (ribokinase family)
MEYKFDLISMGEAVVEVFRKEVDIGLDVPEDFIGPFPSGAPAITVDTMAKLGAKCAFIATVGQDDFGNCVMNRLADDGVDVSGFAQLKNAMTGIAFTNYYSNGDRKFIYNFTTASPAYLTPEMIDPKVIASTKWLHISGNVLAFSESARKAVIKAVKIAHKNNIGISLDPNIRLEIMDKDKLHKLMKPVLDRATVLLPSCGELNLIYGENKKEADIIHSLLKGHIKTIVRKEGENGCSVFTKEKTVHTDAFDNIAEVDPTGCGDAFGAGFIYGMLKGWDNKRITIFANAVGAITATKKGAMEGIKDLDEVKKFLNDRNINIFEGIDNEK